MVVSKTNVERDMSNNFSSQIVVTWDWVVTGIYVVKACSTWRPHCLQVSTHQNLKLEVENYHLNSQCSLAPASQVVRPIGHSATIPWCGVSLHGVWWYRWTLGRITTTLSPPDFTLFCAPLGVTLVTITPRTALHCQRRNWNA